MEWRKKERIVTEGGIEFASSWEAGGREYFPRESKKRTLKWQKGEEASSSESMIDVRSDASWARQ